MKTLKEVQKLNHLSKVVSLIITRRAPYNVRSIKQHCQRYEHERHERHVTVLNCDWSVVINLKH